MDTSDGWWLCQRPDNQGPSSAGAPTLPPGVGHTFLPVQAGARKGTGRWGIGYTGTKARIFSIKLVFSRCEIKKGGALGQRQTYNGTPAAAQSDRHGGSFVWDQQRMKCSSCSRGLEKLAQAKVMPPRDPSFVDELESAKLLYVDEGRRRNCLDQFSRDSRFQRWRAL